MLQFLRPQSVLTTVAVLVAVALPAAAAPDAAVSARVSETYGKLPLSFEANDGQVDKAVRFLSRGPGYSLFLTADEAVLSLGGARDGATVVRMRTVGGRRHPRLTSESPLATRSNYFRGNDSRAWHRDIPSYERVRYESVYPGVDLVYRGNQRQLEYDFVVAPGAAPGRIRLAFQGAESMALGSHGELILHTAHGELVQHPPVVYQEAAGRREPVAGRYVLLSGRRVGFAVGRYDRSRTLVIDPILGYSTFLGGSNVEDTRGMTVDAAGNVYVTGETSSTPFPGVSGSSIQPANGGIYDVYVTKINPAGTAIVYSTYLGGSAVDWGFGVAVDAAGNAYVAGYTNSASFPGVSAGSIQPIYGGGDSDVFLTKINATGSAIVYSTFLGGSADDWGLGVAVDSTGNAYVTGFTTSALFPGINGSSIQPVNAGGSSPGHMGDAFVTKINAAGTAIVYSTFLGGSELDEGWSIAADAAGNAYVTGETHSSTFPGVNGSSIQGSNSSVGSDVFVTKINPAGTAIVYSTFLGGSLDDVGRGIAVDSAGNAYVTGSARSTTFPGVGAGSLQPVNGGGMFSGDGFVTKINPAGTAIVYSTFLGGSGGDDCYGIAVDSAGSVYVTGGTESTSFPGVNGSSVQPVYAGGSGDAFVTKINPTGTAIVYSTFLGGDGGDAGIGIAVDGAGNAYVMGITDSTTFQGVNGSSLQPANGGSGDAFVTKLSEPGRDFYTVTPCRLVDTRAVSGPLGGPGLKAGKTRTFVLTGVCGVPASAKALSVNLTVQPAASGYLRLLPGDQTLLPAISSINYTSGQTRANNATLLLAFDGSGGLQVFSAGDTDFILDVNGYFQ